MKIFKDGGLYLFGEFFAKALPFILLPYLTRKLGADEFGELSYYQAILAFLLIFLGLSQHGAVARYYYFYGNRSINMVVTSGYFLNIFSSLVLILIFILLKHEVLIYITLVAMFQSLIDVQLSLRQCQKKAIQYITIQIVYSALNFSLTILFLELFSTNLVEKRILAMLFSGFISFVIFYFLYIKTLSKSFSYSKRQYKIAIKYILFFGLPLFLHGISGVIKGQFDRILIFNKFSEVELGIYSAGFQVASVLSVAIMALNKAIIPYYYEWLKQKKINKTIIKKYFFLSFLIVPIPGFFAWILPENLYTFFLGEEFAGSKYFVIIFLFSMALNIPYLILVNYLFYYGKNIQISTASIASTIAYVLFLFLIMSFGVAYLPFAGILAELLSLPILYFFCLRTNNNIISILNKDTI